MKGGREEKRREGERQKREREGERMAETH